MLRVASAALGQDSSDEEIFVAFAWKVGPDGKLVIPEGDGKHIHQILVNEFPDTAVRDSCALQTLVLEGPVSPRQYLPGQNVRFRNIHVNTTVRPVALVSLKLDGVDTPTRVVVSPDLPTDCILGN